MHKYLYAGGDPVNAFDPTGRDIIGYALNLANSLKEAIAANLAIIGGAASEAAGAAADSFLEMVTYQIEVGASVEEASATFQEALWTALKSKGIIKLLVCDTASITLAMLDAYAFEKQKLDPVAAAALAGAITVFRDVCKIWP